MEKDLQLRFILGLSYENKGNFIVRRLLPKIFPEIRLDLYHQRGQPELPSREEKFLGPSKGLLAVRLRCQGSCAESRNEDS